MSPQSERSREPIVLAHVPSFRLGVVEVRPSVLQVESGDRRESLEPRVMQVLVALAQAEGALTTRDELIARCWEGRVVGESAIHRVTSRIRQLASGLGKGSFRLESVPKVGYRIVDDTLPMASTQVDEPPVSRDRRSLLGAAAAGAMVAMAGVGILRYRWANVSGDIHDSGTSSNPVARDLFERGMVAQRQALSEQMRQAVAFFREATGVDPDFSESWGALALAYRHLVQIEPESRYQDLVLWSRSAAERALALDPDNADAKSALVLLKPNYRNWAEVEAGCRRVLRQHPDHWMSYAYIGRLMAATGRWREAVAAFEQVVALDGFLPLARVNCARAQWGAGRLQDAEQTLMAAAARWPAHPAIWFTRFDFLAYSGRPSAAIALAEDIEGRPVGIPDAVFALRSLVARAVLTGDEHASEAAAGAALGAAGATSAIPAAVEICCALGRIDTAFALLDSYYLGIATPGIPAPTPTGPLSHRETDVLFALPTAPLRADPRFAALTRAIGLDDYWRETASSPDYRRDRDAIGVQGTPNTAGGPLQA